MSAHPDPARSFGSAAGSYARGRPDYPREAASWLTGPAPLTVLELGAGTGKLTETLIALGHDVLATDPDENMLAILRARHPRVRTALAPAEEIPAADRSVDVVVAAQAFHWFDLDRALPEIARVLKPGGHLALVWNRSDERIPWVRRLDALLGGQGRREDLAEPLVQSHHFGFVEDASFRFWQTVDRQSVQDLALSRSSVAVLDAEGRAAKLEEVLAFYDEYGRGMDGMQLPWTACCFKAVVVSRPDPPRTPVPPREEETSAPEDAAPSEGPSEPSDGTDTDMLLIDFR